MKHTLLTVFAFMAVIGTSCGSDDKEFPNPEPEQTRLVPIRFKIDLDQEVLPYPKTKAMPSLDIGEPTPANKSESSGTDSPADYFEYIDYVVYQVGKSVPYKTSRFTCGNEETNGTDANIQDELLPGEYNICFLAHSDEKATIDQETAVFDRVDDTFHHYVTLDIKEGSAVEQTYTLKRIISNIEFVAKDVVVDSLSHFQINAEGYRKAIDVKTGFATGTATTYEQKDYFQLKDVGKSLTHSFYTFILPTESDKLKINLTTLDKKNGITRKREGIEVTPKRNKIVRFTGVLYTPKVSDDHFNIEIEKDWDSTIEDEDIGK